MLSGNIFRALDVGTLFAGIKATAVILGDTSNLIASAKSLPDQESTAPPNSAAATLSGWPSISVAKVSKSLSLIRSAPPTTKDLDKTKPPTIALADEPKPRPCGRLFSALSASPGYSFLDSPRNSQPLWIALTTRFFSSLVTSSAPSPATSISKFLSSSTCAI